MLLASAIICLHPYTSWTSMYKLRITYIAKLGDFCFCRLSKSPINIISHWKAWHLINKVTMKTLRLFAFAAFLALGSVVVPQTASAYKYYIHVGDGNLITVNANNSSDAIFLFNDLINKGYLDPNTAWLTKRPNGGCIAGCD